MILPKEMRLLSKNNYIKQRPTYKSWAMGALMSPKQHKLLSLPLKYMVTPPLFFKDTIYFVQDHRGINLKLTWKSHTRLLYFTVLEDVL